MLLKMTSLAVPNLMAMIAPFSLLIASLHTLNRLNTDSELIVLSACGSKVWTVARPLLLLAFLVALFLAFVSHFAQPWSMRLLRDYMVQVRTDLLTQVIQPGRFSSPEDDLMFHIRDRTDDGQLIGLVMHDTRDKAQAQTYIAEHGTIVKEEKTSYLVMSTGHILRRTNTNEAPQIVAFDRYVVDLDRFEPQDTGAGEYKPRERYFMELAFPEASSKLYPAIPGQFRAELNERLVAPLYPIAFMFLIIAFVGPARSTRTSGMQSLVTAFFAGTICRMSGLALNSAINTKASMVPVLYAVPIGAILLSLFMIGRFNRQRSGRTLADRISEAFAAVGGAIKSLFARRTARGTPT
jgi:lipopolysaccharide export system permease protein